MDLVQTVRKEGSRGGRAEFKWEDVKNDAQRENYLGHSLMAPVGRWQQGRDLNWYAKGDDESKAAETARIAEEKRKLKEVEEDAMLVAMGLPVPVRNNANLTPLGEKAHAADVKDSLEDKVKKDEDEDEERARRKEKKERSRRHREDDGDRRRRHRSRSRSRDRERRHRHRDRSRSRDRRKHDDRSRSCDRRRHDDRDERRRHRSRSRDSKRRPDRTERPRERDSVGKRTRSRSRDRRQTRDTRSRSPYVHPDRRQWAAGS